MRAYQTGTNFRRSYVTNRQHADHPQKEMNRTWHSIDRQSAKKSITSNQDEANSRFGRSNPGATTRKFDHYGNEIFLYGPVKLASELQKKHSIDLNVYEFKGARKPCYEMSDHARFRIMDVPVTLKDLKRSEQLFLNEPKHMD